MNLPSLIFAEAAVKSSRAGYVSIFDPKAELTDENLKQFYADPNLITQAVQLLKQRGFSILSVGKCSLTVMAPPEAFKNALGVELDGTETGIIPIVEDNVRDIIDSIALSRPASFFDSSVSPPKSDNKYLRQLYLSDLPSALGSSKRNRGVDGKGVRIAVIDSGGRKSHKSVKISTGR